MARSLTSTKFSVRLRTSSIPSGPKSATDSKCLTAASPPRRRPRLARRPSRLAEGDPSGLEADEDDAFQTVVVLDDLVGDAGDGPAQLLCVHDPGPGNENAPVRGRCSSFALGQAGPLSSVPASRDRR